ncbi:hypothetical protein FAJ35_11170 [Streptococcus suis]|uniref:Uncharacterized protein n=1 Tax=Streptococcus suis TaxID=1307 RepID=A0A4T2GMB7_STRSU|nr:hypothetical protein FAJ35_11170 [Streptococcus suis]
MGLFFYTQKGSIISMVDLPTTEIIEPIFFIISLKLTSHSGEFFCVTKKTTQHKAELRLFTSIPLSSDQCVQCHSASL